MPSVEEMTESALEKLDSMTGEELESSWVQARGGEVPSLNDFIHQKIPKEVPRLIVRLKKDLYLTKRGFAEKVSIDFLKRKSQYEVGLIECLQEDICNFEEFCIDWNKYNPGIYEMVMTNLGRDWETGYVDDWDWTLIPYEEENKDEATNNL